MAILGCIADDFTGATDLASMLVEGGMRTLQTIGVPQGSLPEDADAIVVALKSRSIPAADAVSQSLAALAWLQAAGCRQFFFKYCSTFDSTRAGNIGPVADALMTALATDFTIACPAFPENGRTVYRGHLFVNDKLLNESGMQNHPLTPMRDPNLVRVLQEQTHRRVGLLRYDGIAAGPEQVAAKIGELQQEKIEIAIADALSDDDLRVLGAGCAALRLLTGGSGLAIGLPDNYRRQGLLHHASSAARLPNISGGAVVIAGSCSIATNAQVAAWREGRPAFRVEPKALAEGEPVVERALEWATTMLGREPMLIYSTSPADEVKAVQSSLGVDQAGQLVEHALADIARRLCERGARCFVVAGGEVSGAVVSALGVNMLRIGGRIDPGVPWTATVGDAEPLALALKSGNFGAVDFFEKALRLQGMV
ncbi:MAG: 3-oxo-tetronate kinase [Rhodospirillales bacterium]